MDFQMQYRSSEDGPKKTSDLFVPYRPTFDNEMALIQQTRKIYIQGEMNSEASYKVFYALNFLDTENGDLIEVYINSPGGYVHDSLAILDAINRVQYCDLAVVATGAVSSAAAELVALSPKGQRWATPNAIFMFHMARVGWEDEEAEKQKSRALWEDRCETLANQRLAKRIKPTAKKLRDYMRVEWYLTAKEALRERVIDGIWE